MMEHGRTGRTKRQQVEKPWRGTYRTSPRGIFFAARQRQPETVVRMRVMLQTTTGGQDENKSALRQQLLIHE